MKQLNITVQYIKATLDFIFTRKFYKHVRDERSKCKTLKSKKYDVTDVGHQSLA